MNHGLTKQQDRIGGAKGLSIMVRSWLPEREPRAVVLIVHGFNSHSAYYEWAGEQLVAAEYAVYALDLHGRGESEGERFFTEKFDDYLTDVQAALGLARSRQTGLPVFLLGHSAGGVIASNFALDHQAELAGLICESFAFRVYAPNFALSALGWLSGLAPHLRVLTLPNDKFSRDRAAVASMNADPHIAGEKQPALTVAEMWRADQRLEREFGRVTLPLLIMHGTSDKVTKPEGSRMFHERAGSADKTLKLYEGHYHDLLIDTGREKVIADIVGWLDERSPRPVRSEVVVDYPLAVDDVQPSREAGPIDAPARSDGPTGHSPNPA